MSLVCQRKMRRRRRRWGWLHIWTWPCATLNFTNQTKLWKTVTKYGNVSFWSDFVFFIFLCLHSTCLLIMFTWQKDHLYTPLTGFGDGRLQWKGPVSKGGGTFCYEWVWQGKRWLPTSSSAVSCQQGCQESGTTSPEKIQTFHLFPFTVFL